MSKPLESFVAWTLKDRLRDADRLAADLHRAGASPTGITQALKRATALAPEADARITAMVHLVERIDLGRETLAISIRSASLACGSEHDHDPALDPIRIEAPLRTRQAGRAKLIVIGLDRRERKPDAELIAMVADARRWAGELLSGATASVGEIERREGA